MSSTQCLEELTALGEQTVNRHLEQAKAAGRPIVGTFCSYVPAEIITAAGCVPYRMRGVGSQSTQLADVYFSAKNCTVPRHIFNKALAREFDWLDGLVFLNSCDHTRRLYDNWRHAGLGPAFKHFLVVPHVITDVARDAYVDEIIKLSDALASFAGQPMSRGSLLDAIAKHNAQRALLRKVHALLALPEPKVRMSELVRIMLAVTALPVEVANGLLTSLVGELDGRPMLEDKKLRLVLCGGCVEEAAHIEEIEAHGAQIVADYICLGRRAVDSDIDAPGSASLEQLQRAVATRAFDSLSCPRMANDTPRRLKALVDAVRATGAHGVIAEKMAFCLLFAGETLLYREELREHGIPLLTLEREYGSPTSGQLKTRLQAFTEELCDDCGCDKPRRAAL